MAAFEDPSVLSNWLAGDILNRYLTQAVVYVGVATTDPGPAGDASTEATGPEYTRVRVTFGPAANRTVTNVGAGRFQQLPAGSYWGLTLWDAISAGHLLARLAFVDVDGDLAPLSAVSLSGLPFQPGDIAVSL